MDCVSRTISKTSITTHVEISFLAVVVACTLVDYPLVGFVQFYWFSNGIKDWTVPGERDQWLWGMDCVKGEGINGFRDKGSMAARYLVFFLMVLSPYWSTPQ